MPLFQRDDQFLSGHSFLEAAYTYRGQNQYNFLTLRLNGQSDIKIHALVFFSAFPWLKIDLNDDFFVIIGDNSGIDPPCLAIFDKLLHFGEATCPDKKVLNSAQVLCDFFGMSVSFDEIVSKYESSDVPRNDLDNEVSSDNDENEIKSNVWFMSYSKCSNWRRISKLWLDFGCLFTFCYLDMANSIKTDLLHICNLWTGQFVSCKSVI